MGMRVLKRVNFTRRQRFTVPDIETSVDQNTNNITPACLLGDRPPALVSSSFKTVRP